MPRKAVWLPQFTVDYSLCTPNRIGLETGLSARHHGVTHHGEVTDGSVFSAHTTATLPVSTGAGWDRDHGSKILFVAAQASGYKTAHFGKKFNDAPFLRGDAYQFPGLHKQWLIRDDNNLGGAHAKHSHRYLGYVVCNDGTVQTIGDPTNQDVVNGSNIDSWPAGGVGFTAAAQAARTGATTYITDRLSQELRTWIGTVPATQPFFAVMSERAIHDVMLSSARHTSANDTTEIADKSTSAADPPSWAEGFTGAADSSAADKPPWVIAVRPTQAAWTAEVTNIRNLRRRAYRTARPVAEAIYDIRAELSTAGRLDNTIFVAVSDNGALEGNHGIISGGLGPTKNVAYEPSIRVGAWVDYPDPLPARPNVILVVVDDAPVDVMRWIGENALTGATQSTSQALGWSPDVAVTIADLIGARLPRGADGMSWRALLEGRATALRQATLHTWATNSETSVPTYTCVRTASAKLVVYGDTAQGEEIYNLATDPDETANLAGTTTGASLAAPLRDHLVVALR